VYQRTNINTIQEIMKTYLMTVKNVYIMRQRIIELKVEVEEVIYLN